VGAHLLLAGRVSLSRCLFVPFLTTAETGNLSRYRQVPIGQLDERARDNEMGGLMQQLIPVGFRYFKKRINSKLLSAAQMFIIPLKLGTRFLLTSM
jgi:hypothetical protein